MKKKVFIIVLLVFLISTSCICLDIGDLLMNLVTQLDSSLFPEWEYTDQEIYATLNPPQEICYNKGQEVLCHAHVNLINAYTPICKVSVGGLAETERLEVGETELYSIPYQRGSQSVLAWDCNYELIFETIIQLEYNEYDYLYVKDSTILVVNPNTVK